MAIVQVDSFVTLHYRLFDNNKDYINTFIGKPATLSLGNVQIAPILENKLIGLKEGERKTFHFVKNLVFGEYKQELQQLISKKLLKNLSQKDFNIGDVVQFPAPNSLDNYSGTLIKEQKNGFLFDFNHPLADKELNFEVLIIGII